MSIDTYKMQIDSPKSLLVQRWEMMLRHDLIQ